MLISCFDQWHFSSSFTTVFLKLGYICTKFYRFVKYTPVKCFNKFVQSAVNCRRQRDENPNSSAVAETMKLLAKSWHGYQFMDRSCHSFTKYTNDEKTHAAITNKLFKKLGFINDQLCEVDLAKSGIEHKEPINIGFVILHYPKLRMLELYYNYFTKFCDTDKYEEIEMYSDSLYLALAEKESYDCMRSEKRREWESLRSKNSKDSFTAGACSYCFRRTCCAKDRKLDKRKPGFFKVQFRCTELFCLCSKTYCFYDALSNKFKCNSEGLNK